MKTWSRLASTPTSDNCRCPREATLARWLLIGVSPLAVLRRIGPDPRPEPADRLRGAPRQKSFCLQVKREIFLESCELFRRVYACHPRPGLRRVWDGFRVLAELLPRTGLCCKGWCFVNLNTARRSRGFGGIGESRDQGIQQD